MPAINTAFVLKAVTPVTVARQGARNDWETPPSRMVYADAHSTGPFAKAGQFPLPRETDAPALPRRKFLKKLAIAEAP
jgi:hypothetical protein